ncbi:hypothetical protein NLJ89_g37 [Agrocybe chaxingu]|uniref:Uncharacterized protein n=1 Tax=Agrocybe chaxingu TaxID=84603 RepID=A0A9W8N2Q6_9AGAR|nr:hypothetical protein NLJ89_g37 [Agrocybe chaxingu]
MSATPSSDIAVKPIQRVDSGETDESPFGSNLVTPKDGDPYSSVGIHERLDAANAALGYFASKDVRHETTPPSIVVQASETEDHVIQPSPKTPQTRRLFVEKQIHVVEIPAAEKQDDSDAVFPTSDSEESMLSSASESIRARSRRGSIYTLPNDHISIAAPPNTPVPDAETQKGALDGVVDEPGIIGLSTFSTVNMELLVRNFDMHSLSSLALKVMFFVPWCIAVGGSLALAPDHVDRIAFGLGYLEPPPTPIHRFSHWANYGLQHVSIFLALVAIIVYSFPSSGLVLCGGLLAQFSWEWHAFLADHTKSLGSDDRQTVHLLATTIWLNGDAPQVTKRGEDYYCLA